MSGPIKAVGLLMGTRLDEAGASSTDAEADSCQVYSVTSRVTTWRYGQLL